jgi:hypothetical protein
VTKFEHADDKGKAIGKPGPRFIVELSIDKVLKGSGLSKGKKLRVQGWQSGAQEQRYIPQGEGKVVVFLRRIPAGYKLLAPGGFRKPRTRLTSREPLNSAKVIGHLSKAHALLAKGLHDYKGHRIRAAREIHHAITALGGKSPGEAAKAPKEGQKKSDHLLREAKTILEAAHKELMAGKGKKDKQAAKQVQKAIKELTAALKVA